MKYYDFKFKPELLFGVLTLIVTLALQFIVDVDDFTQWREWVPAMGGAVTRAAAAGILVMLAQSATTMLTLLLRVVHLQ